VDGRVYRSAEFLAEAERYHELAVAAHDSHSTVPVPMPDWRPAPELVASSSGNGGPAAAAPAPDDPFGYPSAPPTAEEGRPTGPG
jgi:hypothetical protein